MLIIPAIDLKNGTCVRLRQGRMDDATVYSDDPVATASRWVEAGAERLHVVDLDGAFAGKPENKEAVAGILAKFPELPVQLGGGVRDLATVEVYLDLGLSWVIIGTQAVKEPEFVTEACQRFPVISSLALMPKMAGLQLKVGQSASTVSATEVVKRFVDVGVSVVYTDIGRDGMLSGVNIDATASLAQERHDVRSSRLAD